MKETLVFGSTLALIVFAVMAMDWGLKKEKAEWEKFAQEHHCVKVQIMKGSIMISVGPIISPKGEVSTTVLTSFADDKEAWSCNNGITYWR